MSGSASRGRMARFGLAGTLASAALLSGVVSGGGGEPTSAQAVDCVIASSAPNRSGRKVTVVHLVRCDRPVALGAAQVLRNGRVVASRAWSPPLDAGLYRLRQRVPLECGAVYRGRYFADGWRYGPPRRFCPKAVAG